MALELVNYGEKTREAVRFFWQNRAFAQQKNTESGAVDQGSRGAVTGGKNMDGFIALVKDLIAANGLADAELKLNSAALTLPGYFRPTKRWDSLLMKEGRLIAALELKSQVGSFGNNFNNRAEEVIGTSLDFWTAFREKAFGEIARPFVGWLMLVEDHTKSRTPVKEDEPNFPMFSEFRNSSYIQRYDILCRRLVSERLYTTATVISSPESAIETGEYAEISELTGVRTFVTNFAAHIAAEAARG